MRISIQVVCVSLNLAIAILTSDSAQSAYTFTSIADNTGPFSSFGDPLVNGSNAVTFFARLDTGGTGIFAGSGSSITTIADRSGAFSGFSWRPSVNPAGTVAFHADHNVRNGVWGATGLYTSTGGLISAIANDSGQFASFGNPSINAAGTVAFQAICDAGGEGIFATTGGSTTVVADSSGMFHWFFGDLSINSGGMVAFAAVLDAGHFGLFAGSGGAITSIADTLGPFSALGAPAINDDGVVTFVAYFRAGGNGIFAGNGGAASIIADTSGPFSRVDHPSINADGMIALLAEFDAGGSGIFTAYGSGVDAVIKSGDPLFGAKVAGLGFYRGLNDNGAIAFRYTLDNGVSGIALARAIPEPTAIVLLSIATLGLLTRYARDCRVVRH
ncbi:MAG: hypothetical protein H0T51_13520 [Pirellulales bacterium]|nr:hypothetical protein [Pirellulales bacterium]